MLEFDKVIEKKWAQITKEVYLIHKKLRRLRN